MELGIYTFGELTDPSLTVQQRLANLLEEIVLADEVGLDVFGVGRAPPARVHRLRARRRARRGGGPHQAIRLTSAVSVLSLG